MSLHLQHTRTPWWACLPSATWRPSVCSRCRLWRLHIYIYVVTKIFTSKNVLLLHRVYSVNHGHNMYGVTQPCICNKAVNNSCTFAVGTGKLQSPWHLAMALQHCDGLLQVTQLPRIFQPARSPHSALSWLTAWFARVVKDQHQNNGGMFREEVISDWRGFHISQFTAANITL